MALNNKNIPNKYSIESEFLMKKVLITGGMGYVGNVLTWHLSRRDDIQITVLDNMMVDGTPMPLYRGDNVKIIEGDIRNHLLVKTLLPQFDSIIHLAAIVGEPSCIIDTAFSYDVNVNGTVNLLNYANPATQFIFASSSSVYGDRPNEKVTEKSEPIPTNYYARQKHLAEEAIQQSSNNYIILRPVTAYGISLQMRLDLLVNTLVYEALTKDVIDLYEPNVIRPIIHVFDYVSVIEYAIDGHLGANEVYNIGNPLFTMTKEKLVRTIAEATGASINNIQQTSLDLRNYDVSFDKLLNAGFKFKENSLDDMIESLDYKIPYLIDNIEKYYRPNTVKAYLERTRFNVSS